MSKICILSMQMVRNIGSCLQAYALSKIVKELGHDVYFIDIEKREEDNILLNKNRNSFTYETNDSNSVFDKIKKIDNQFIQRIRAKIIWEKQGRILDDFRKNVLGISSESNSDTYDICIIGSDEVFNCLSTGEWGFTSQLFGDVKQAKKVITYAASCGATNIYQVPLNVQSRIKQAFERVSYFSVRDNNTKNFVEKLTNKNVITNLDPVLVGDFSNETRDLPRIINDDYCIVYSYFNRFNSKEEIEGIKMFCNEKNLKIVGVGAPQLWIKNNLALNPFETIKLFKNARFVITDTFHGTILAAKYCGNFATLQRDSNSFKLNDLLERLDIKNHEITNITDIEVAYRQKNTKDSVANILQYERKRTSLYLRKALNGEEEI